MGRSKKTEEKSVQKVTKPKAKTLEELRNELLLEAEKKGVSEQYLFKTTFRRYEMQLDIMRKLEAEIKKSDAIVTKKYGTKENQYVNPAISEYNKTASAANGTVAALMKILSNLAAENEAQPGSQVREFCGL